MRGEEVDEFTFSPDGKYLGSAPRTGFRGFNTFICGTSQNFQENSLQDLATYLESIRNICVSPPTAHFWPVETLLARFTFGDLMILDLRCIRSIVRNYLGSRSVKEGTC
jgi:hypothetical protein